MLRIAAPIWYRAGVNPARSNVIAAFVALVATACSTTGPTGDASADSGSDARTSDASDVTSTDAPISDGATADGDSPDTAIDSPFSMHYTDPFVVQRRNCAFRAGARVAQTLGFTDDSRAHFPIAARDIRIIVLMQENRSFDHYLGHSGRNDIDGIPPGYSNPDGTATVRPAHATSTCLADQTHQWIGMHAQWNLGQMDGFAASGGTRSLAYYDRTDLPFYYWLYDTYAVSDRFFSSVMSGTWANRDYLYAGTSAGVRNTSEAMIDVPTVFEQLRDAGVTWNVYYDGWQPQVSVTGNAALVRMLQTHRESATMFISQAANGMLPQVSFIDGTGAGQDEHPPDDISRAEHWVRSLYSAVQSGPDWQHTILFFTYDESGGYLDHVPPPEACVPDTHANNAEFNRLGIRVPVVAISPWARRGFVSHSVHQTTSVLRFIQTIFDLPALTNRDANSDAMLDMFDFDAPQLTTPGAPTAAGMSHCP